MGLRCVWVLIIVVVVMTMLNISDGEKGEPPKIFNVKSYGAVADGHTDNSKVYIYIFVYVIFVFMKILYLLVSSTCYLYRMRWWVEYFQNVQLINAPNIVIR